jgi:hypothetical protein
MTFKGQMLGIHLARRQEPPNPSARAGVVQVGGGDAGGV